MAAFKITCPTCAASLTSSSPVPGGKTVKCPRCGQAFQIPVPPTIEVIPTAILDEPRIPKRPRKLVPRRVVRRDYSKSGIPLALQFAGGIAAVFLVAIGVLAGIFYWPKGNYPFAMNRPSAAVTPAFEQSKDSWLKDWDRAKKQATEENKDILVQLESWKDTSPKLLELLGNPDLRGQARRTFVLASTTFYSPYVYHMESPDQNEIHKDFALADSLGRVYVFLDYEKGDLAELLAEFAKLQKVKSERDLLIKKIDQAEGAAKLSAAKAALAFLKENKTVDFYGPQLSQWLGIAHTFDPKNEKGDLELFFEADWVASVFRPSTNMEHELTRLEEWKKIGRFKDPDRAGGIYFVAGSIRAYANNLEGALKLFKEGQSYKPSNPSISRQLTQAVASSRSIHGSGTGWVISEKGYLLTNYHVIHGPGRVFVRLPSIEEPVLAEVVAQDQNRDMAIIRINVPSSVHLKALTIASDRSIGRGEQVATLGFPLGDYVGSGIKLTTGVVSATPEAGNGNMYVLDAKVNPGNSGGPLCDSAGNVVGMVTAKSYSNSHVDSYGMALPAPDLESFLKKKLKSYQRPTNDPRKKPWDEVDRLVSPSVFMVIKAP